MPLYCPDAATAMCGRPPTRRVPSHAPRPHGQRLLALLPQFQLHMLHAPGPFHVRTGRTTCRAHWSRRNERNVAKCSAPAPPIPASQEYQGTLVLHAPDLAQKQSRSDPIRSSPSSRTPRQIGSAYLPASRSPLGSTCTGSDPRWCRSRSRRPAVQHRLWLVCKLSINPHVRSCDHLRGSPSGPVKLFQIVE